ncbi:hypothetical protein DM47_2937 [Burkholderia mallei]|nr:hypothetical protein DM75_3894 [Burkholderia mallei]KOS93723.1 hypothetical protein DM45_3464 [Burkholderia mallei]KOT19685.1 hypothetical protein DM47_2937 [Burkholderia mallei]
MPAGLEKTSKLYRSAPLHVVSSTLRESARRLAGRRTAPRRGSSKRKKSFMLVRVITSDGGAVRRVRRRLSPPYFVS